MEFNSGKELLPTIGRLVDYKDTPLLPSSNTPPSLESPSSILLHKAPAAHYCVILSNHEGDIELDLVKQENITLRLHFISPILASLPRNKSTITDPILIILYSCMYCMVFIKSTIDF